MAASVPLPSEEPPATQAAEDVDMGFDDAVKDFAWPMPEKILGIQKVAWKAAGEDVTNVTWSVSDRCYVSVAGKIWIPETAGTGGVTPVTAFQGLPSLTPLVGSYTQGQRKYSWLSKARQKHMDALRKAMDNMLRDVAVRSEKLRQQARGRRENNAHVRLAKFALGDFVLLGKSIKFPTKLALNSKGPYRVSRVDSDYVMEVQKLVETFATSVHHASRLKFFSDAALDVTDALVDYA
ncbi:hypothetical protein DYB25_014338, partial [Aphanomyces astaci]